VKKSHWAQWHEPYDDPSSPLSARLHEVKVQLGRALDAAPPGPLRLLSMCAGQGRDVIEVLATHPRGRDVTARLVEADPQNAEDATSRTAEIGRSDIEVVCGDASVTDAYDGIVPAGVLVVCGVFGNISAADMALCISLLPSLSAPGARVIWTRHHRPPDQTGFIRSTFEQTGFVEEAYAAPEGFVFAVGTQRLDREPDQYEPGRRLFNFVGDGALPA
jgi:hypothetical protein